MPAEIRISPEFTAYEPKEQHLYPIPEPDWNRLKRLANRLSTEESTWVTLAGASFGVAGSAVVSFLGFLAADNLSEWVLPVTGVTAVFSTLLGLVFLNSEPQKKEEEKHRASPADLREEMRLIEARYKRPDEEPNTPATDARRFLLEGILDALGTEPVLPEETNEASTKLWPPAEAQDE